MNLARALTILSFFVLIGAFAIWLTAHDRSHVAPTGSVDRQGMNGCSLILAYLRKRGIDAQPLHRPLVIGTAPADAVVLRLGVTTSHLDEPRLSANERAWITAGGRLVLAESGDDDADTDDDTDTGTGTKLAVCLPLWPGVAHLEPTMVRGLAEPRGAVVVRAGTAAVITCERIGAGELIRLTCADCLYDDHLATADHLALLHGLAAVGSGRSVRFDEHALGRGGLPLGELLRRLGLAPAALLALVILGLWFWRRAISNGPTDGPPPERREDAIDLLDSLGELLGEHLDDRALLDAYQERLRVIVARRSGLRDAELDRALHRILGPPSPSSGRHAFRLRLDHLNAAFERAHHERSG